MKQIWHEKRDVGKRNIRFCGEYGGVLDRTATYYAHTIAYYDKQIGVLSMHAYRSADGDRMDLAKERRLMYVASREDALRHVIGFAETYYFTAESAVPADDTRTDAEVIADVMAEDY